jgi:hypothetical protein
MKKKLKKQGVKVPGESLQTGAVTIIQNFGSSINANPHFHCLFIDGAFEVPSKKEKTKERPAFHKIESYTDEDIQALVKTIALRVIRYLQHQGHFQDDTPALTINADESDPLAALHGASVASQVAFGAKKGQYVRRLGSFGRMVDESPISKTPLCAAIQNFSLHAGVFCAHNERKKLEKVARYIARPAVSEDRCHVSASGEITYTLKHPYTDGTPCLSFEPIELIGKLAALIPRPRIHMIRYFGVLLIGSLVSRHRRTDFEQICLRRLRKMRGIAPLF